MPYIQSPLNYTGGKYKLLPQIEPLFPRDINTFVDVFCGGGNVGVNVNCERVIFNDKDKSVIGILRLLHGTNPDKIHANILKIINDFDLSLVSDKGYDFYGCNSSDGLSEYNRQPFLQLRDYFNNLKRKDKSYYTILYVLILYAFNNQIRFNGNGQYNLPVGKRDYNSDMQTKLRDFVTRLQNKNFSFVSHDFSYFRPQLFTPQDFVYADPPYLITCATYNEKDGWNETAERRLHRYLDSLNSQGVRFALSNVLSSKGKTNDVLREWLDIHKSEYVCHHLNFDYSNSNYHTTDRTTGSDEVLITNY